MDPRPLILAVEDEPRNSALLRAVLPAGRYDLEIAPDLASARRWLEARVADVLLLDRHLPDGDGLDLLRWVKGDHRLGDMPVILLSASVLPEDIAAAEAAGVDRFMPKPLSVVELMAEVDRLAGRTP